MLEYRYFCCFVLMLPLALPKTFSGFYTQESLLVGLREPHGVLEIGLATCKENILSVGIGTHVLLV